MKRLPPALLVAFATLNLASLFAAEPPAAAASPATKFGRLAPGDLVPDFAATDADGKPVNLAALRGRVVVLNFWATNREPLQPLLTLAEAYRGQNIAVLGICTGATRAEFDAWQAKHRDALNYPLLWDPAGPARSESILQRTFGFGALPATAVIEREGKLVGGLVGFGAATRTVLLGYLRDAGLALTAGDVAALAPPAPPAAAPREDKTLKPGTVAPDFTALDLAGKPVKLSDFAGKIVVLDFWATWCGPCIHSMPHTQKVAAATKDKGVVVLAACTSDFREKFEAWVREKQSEFPDLIFANDPKGRDAPPEEFAERVSVKLYGVSGIPTQFVIGRDGRIADVLIGFGEGDTRLEAALARLGVPIEPAKPAAAAQTAP